jgi:hypothetical protein
MKWQRLTYPIVAGVVKRRRGDGPLLGLGALGDAFPVDERVATVAGSSWDAQWFGSGIARRPSCRPSQTHQARRGRAVGRLVDADGIYRTDHNSSQFLHNEPLRFLLI